MMRSKGERGSRASHAGQEEAGGADQALHSMLSGEYTEESTDARTIRQTGGKDRHSKVFTSRGPRDRRVRLSVGTAIRFYDLQDRLGFEQPSKAVEWLLLHCQPSIKALPSLDSHLRSAALPVQPGYHSDHPQPHIPANKELMSFSNEDSTYFSPDNFRSGQNAHHEHRSQALNSQYNQKTHIQILNDHDLDTLALYNSHPRASIDQTVPSVQSSIPSSCGGSTEHGVSTSLVSQLQTLDAATSRSGQAVLTFPSQATFNHLGAHQESNLTSEPALLMSKSRSGMQSLPICFSPDGDARAAGDYATFRYNGNAAGTGRTMAQSVCSVHGTSTAAMYRALPSNYSSLISNAPTVSKEIDLLMNNSMDNSMDSESIAQLQQRLVADQTVNIANGPLMPFQELVAGVGSSLSASLSGNVEDTMTQLYEKMATTYRNNPMDVLSPREANNISSAASTSAYNSEANDEYRQAFHYT